MNLTQIKLDGDWRAAIRAIGKSRIENLFDQIKQVELEAMEHCPKEELTDRQARVKLVSELRDLFLQVKPASRTNPDDD